MVCLNLIQIRLLEFDFRKKVKVQLYRSNIVKNVETHDLTVLYHYQLIWLKKSKFWVVIRKVGNFINLVTVRHIYILQKIIQHGVWCMVDF